MPRRGRRPPFTHSEKIALLEALATARRRVILCGASEGFGSSLYTTCDLVTAAIDGLAERLTGNPRYFATAGHGSAPPANTFDGRKGS